jgi:protein-S-isoprenylcysteine O-methyltransferase Ste14
MVIDSLRLFLLFGLLLHKAVWEAMKFGQQRQASSSEPTSPMVALTKAIKIAILLGILLQTVCPEILPISPDPHVLVQVGTALFTIGLTLAIVARIQLGRQWSDIEVGSVAADHAIIDRGVYGLIRHPIYSGDLIMLTGLELALNSWLVLGVAVLMAAVYWKAGKEERKLADQLPGYRQYQERTKRFVPFVV